MMSFARSAAVAAFLMAAATVNNADAFSTTPAVRQRAAASLPQQQFRASSMQLNAYVEADSINGVNGAVVEESAKKKKLSGPNTVEATTLSYPNDSKLPGDPRSVSMIYAPNEAFQLLAKRGEGLVNTSAIKTIVSSLFGGMYVGMGGMLSLAIAGNMAGVATTNPGLVKFVFAALFPVNLLVCLLAGGQLFTGNTANMIAAFCEKKAGVRDVIRNWFYSYTFNFVGCAGFALLCKYCGVLSGGAAEMAANLLAAKTSIAFGPILVRAMLCNWLVCLAVYLSMQAKDMTGKYVGIFLPISAFVSIGFEHSVANMFILPAGLLSTTAGITAKTALIKNLLPVSLGNAISGSLLVGALFSFMFGRLGEGK